MSEDLDPVLQLVRRGQAGPDREESARMLFAMFGRSIFSYFRRKGFSEEESLDLSQESFLQILKSLNTFRGDSDFHVWVFGVARNIYRNKLRARLRSGMEFSVDADLSSPQLPSSDKSALDTLIEREQTDALRAVLQGFPPQMRECCVLRYERNLKYHEIATIMKISIDTVKAHLHQARKRLSAKLGDTVPT